MKYNKDKIKKEHHSLKEFSKFLDSFAKNEAVTRLIPGRIRRKQCGASKKSISFSYFTESGCKLILKKGGTAQELFVVFKKEYRTDIENYLKDMSIIK